LVRHPLNLHALFFPTCLDFPNEQSRQSRHVTGTIIARVLAVIGAAVLTLATMVALVQGTILAVSIANPPLRILAVVADGLLGTVLLVWCIYLATHLAVRILGVGQDDFPPLPEDTSQINLPKN
jgi:hypothetical protein